MAGFPAAVPDVEIYAGDTFEWPKFRITTDGAPIDLTVWDEWRARWRPAPGSASEVELSIDFTEAADGYLSILAPADTTRAMQNLAKRMWDGFGYWDVQASKDGIVRTWLRGRTTNREDITR